MPTTIVPSASARLDQALAAYRRILDEELASAADLNRRGMELMRSGASLDALACFERARLIAPALAATYFNRGLVLTTLRRFEEALDSYRQARAQGLEIAEVHQQTGIALHNMGRVHEALASFDLALSLRPASPHLLNCRGFALYDLGRLDEAKASYNDALAIQPDFPMAKLNLGIACLASGEWREGWAYYESRWQGAHEAQQGRYHRPVTSLPQWQGEAVSRTDRLLVLSEQGLGDAMQFSRYLLLAAQRFAKVSFVCPLPLVRLFQASFSPEIEILAMLPPDQSAWHLHCPLMSLPRAFGTTLENVPAPIPYLRVRPQWCDPWRNKLETAAGNRLRVGLVWAGDKGHKSDASRSMAFQQFSALLSKTDIAWVSLQKSDGASPHKNLLAAAGMLDWMEEVKDFADTAALVSMLDLVIAVDTSVVHLAGALDKPVWMLNKYESEWRWMRNREDSPWYQRLRIFNQDKPAEWEQVLSCVDAALTNAMQDAAFSHKSSPFQGDRTP